MNSKKQILFVMGVSGSGKTTVGKLLANRLNIPFFDGDDFHPKANVEKMAKGHPLNDEDRTGWLQRLNQLAREQKSEGAVIACSALKKIYRKLLREGVENQMQFVYLEGSFELVTQRIQQRKGHFMPPELLRSQFQALEVPKHAISVSIQPKPEVIVNEILEKI